MTPIQKQEQETIHGALARIIEAQQCRIQYLEDQLKNAEEKLKASSVTSIKLEDCCLICGHRIKWETNGFLYCGCSRWQYVNGVLQTV